MVRIGIFPFQWCGGLVVLTDVAHEFLVEVLLSVPMKNIPLLRTFVASTTIVICLDADAASVAPVAVQNGMVVTAQHLASQVGVGVLKKGGNAIDAAVAVGYALAVVYPRQRETWVAAGS